MESVSVFDRSDIYASRIEPIVKKLKNECAVAHIPFFFSACVKNDEEGTEYQNEGHLCGSGDYKLTDDRITPHLNVALGFKTVPPRSDMEIDMDMMNAWEFDEEEID